MSDVTNCESCAALRLELDDARRQLAQSREQLNALRLFLHHPDGDASVHYYPTPPSVEKPPLRYVVADVANDTLKKIARQLFPRASSRSKTP